jgi:hypothetical protein
VALITPVSKCGFRLAISIRRSKIVAIMWLI